MYSWWVKVEWLSEASVSRCGSVCGHQEGRSTYSDVSPNSLITCDPFPSPKCGMHLHMYVLALSQLENSQRLDMHILSVCIPRVWVLVLDPSSWIQSGWSRVIELASSLLLAEVVRPFEYAKTPCMCVVTAAMYQKFHMQLNLTENFSPHLSTSPFPMQWYIQGACATQGTGLYEGLDWLSKELSN